MISIKPKNNYLAAIYENSLFRDFKECQFFSTRKILLL